MDTQEYKQRVDLLEKRRDIKLAPGVLGDYEKIYVLSSANISKVLPEIPKGEHEKLCRYNFFYKYLSSLQVQNVKLIENVKQVGNLDFLQDITASPRIFCTFHMGSYRLINLWLAWHNVDFVLVLSKETLKEQKDVYLQSYNDVSKLRGTGASFEFVEAENPSSLITMTKALKSGKSLLFYIDGNTGVGGVGKVDNNMLSIKFGDTSIYARKGISFLSHKLNVPIINCFSYIEEERDNVTIQFNDPICSSKELSIHDYCQSTTQRIYDEFFEILKLYPEQWEGWMYVHRYMDLEVFRDKEESLDRFEMDDVFIYNQDRFDDFMHENKQYLLDTMTYNIYPVTKPLVDILKVSNFKMRDDIVPQDVFKF